MNLENSSNAANISYLIPFCYENTDICISETWFEYVIYFINIVSIIVNAFHIYVLRRFRSDTQKIYLTMLVLLTVSDILASVRILLDTSCWVRTAAVNSYTVAIPILFLVDTINFFRFTNLSLAFFDRWLALARPFTYQTSVFANYFWVWFLFPNTVICVLTLARDLIYPDEICLDAITGIRNCNGTITKLMTCSVFITGAFAFTTLFIILLLIELRKMRKKASLSDSDQQLSKATRTMLAVVLLYYGFLMCQPFVAIIDAIPPVSDDTIRFLKLMTDIVYSLYGLSNIVVYGLINESYRKELQKLFKKLLPVSNVVADSTSARHTEVTTTA